MKRLIYLATCLTVAGAVVQWAGSLPLVAMPVVPTAEVQNSDLLKPGDRLRITVAGFPDLSGEQMIAADGTIQLPMVGTLNLNRLNPMQATSRISEALLPYVRRPQVSLALVSISPIRITVTGEVVQPGPRLLSPYTTANSANPDTPVTPLTLSAALTQAGGVTPSANIQNVIIRRLPVPDASGDRPVDSTAKTEITINLWEAVQSGNLAADPRIYDGDEIIVPTIQTASNQQALLSSTIAPAQIQVQVAGEVASPGSIELRPGADLNAAIAAAGGPTDEADTDDVVLLRMAANGTLQRQVFEFGEASQTLMNGDVIVVEKRSGNRFLDTLGDILQPLGILLDIF